MTNKPGLNPREFLGEEFYKACLLDLETIQAYRNIVSKRKPTEEEKLILQVNKPWIPFYRSILGLSD